jgi:pimeloyl-ACP methyl ester carboxylesterase
MRPSRWAYLSTGLALSGLCFFGFYALRQPDIPHAVLDRKYADHRSAFFDGPHGTVIHYCDDGNRDRPVLMLVHGYAASLHTWRPWIERLRKDYRLVSVDLPGHGLTRTPKGYKVTRDSFADVIEATAAHLGIDRFTLVGSSMGGAAEWDYAARRPEWVDSLVLVASAGWTPGPDDSVMPSAVETLLNSPMGPLFRDLDNTPLMRKGLRAAFANEGLAHEPMVERYVELARAPMHRDVQMQLALNRAERLYADKAVLSRIRAPTLVLHGDRDRVVPAEDGLRFISSIRDSRLIVYEGVGHILQEEIAEQSAGDLRDFLDEVLWREANDRHKLAA